MPRLTRAQLVPVAFALVLGLALAWPALGRPERVLGGGPDLPGTLWFHTWIRRCLETGQDPSFTRLFFFPDGKDVFAHTGDNFLDALLSVPVQWAFGHPGWYGPWIALLCAGNLLSAYLLLRAEPDPGGGELPAPAALWAAAAWAANAFVLTQLGEGRPTQAFLWFLPLALLALRRLERGWGTAVLAGLAVGLVGWGYWFYGVFLAFALLPWLVAAGWERPREERGRWLGRLVVAGLVTAAVVAPAVVAMARLGAAEAVPGLHGGGPEPLGYLPFTAGAGPTPPPTGGFVPVGTPDPLASPWLFALGALVALRRGRWVGVAVVGLLLATGPSVPTTAGPVPMPHYQLLLRGVPFLERLWFPDRALVLVYLAAAAGFAALLAVAARRLGPCGLHLVGAAGLLLTVGASAREGRLPLPVQELVTPAVYDWMGPQGGAILDLPPGVAQSTLVHQPVHGLPLFGGMGEDLPAFVPPAHRARTRNALVAALGAASTRPTPAPTPPEAARAELLGWGVRWVVLHGDLLGDSGPAGRRALNDQGRRDPRAPTAAVDPAGARRQVEALLGPPVAVDGALVVWALGPVAEAPEGLRP